MAKRKAKDNKPVATGSPEYAGTFLENYVSWRGPELQGQTAKIDKTMGKVRGGNARSGLPFTAQRLRKIVDKPESAPGVRHRAGINLGTAELMMKDKGVKNKPTTIETIKGNYESLLGSAVQRGIDDNTAIPGTGFYFDARRFQESEVDKNANLSNRQITAMSARLSPGKKPKDEIASLGGVSRLVSSESEQTINGRRIKDIQSADLGRLAAHASSWNAYEERPNAKIRPEAPKPEVSSPSASEALIKAGRAHSSNVTEALRIARNETTPLESFGKTTPKTAAYGEMFAQSDPNSAIEQDYRNISAHYRDVVEGKVSKDQGMLMFSQGHEGPRPHALRSDAPTAIDTWMVAAGSGQPLKAKRPDTGRPYSPAKRLVDKMFPLDPAAYGKRRLGAGKTPANVDAPALVSAQHNEAIRQLSEERIGAISFDQFGQNIHLPSSVIQETVWTEARRQAGGDPEFNKAQGAKSKADRQSAKEEKANAKIASKQQNDQLKLF